MQRKLISEQSISLRLQRDVSKFLVMHLGLLSTFFNKLKR